MKSSGSVPEDFTTLSSEKFEHDFEENQNKELDKEFFLTTRFYIDELLLSGRVLFNEPLSNYLNKVAKYVLRREKKLQKELRFYVLKSTAVNAFSTDQGIILFTTGLLAQVESEAQLAFIIAHEVSHYTEKHVKEGYVESQNQKKSKGRYKRMSHDEAVAQLSRYNQKSELEADVKGLEILLDSEYDMEEAFAAFEVLLYSYLPFDEKVFDTTYFDTEILQMPGILFPDTINPITLTEDYDDEGSTHPNIQKRMDEAVEFLDGKDSKGKLKYKISEEEFKKVQTLARFELVNLDLANRNYADALYEIYLLEKTHPDNRFLDISKVKALYGLGKYKNHGRFNEVTRKLKDVEGESYMLHYFLKEMNRAQLNVLVLRHLADMHAKYPNDEYFKKYFEDYKKEFALRSKIPFDDLKSEPYVIFDAKLDSALVEFDVEDSIRKIDESDLSKYQKIKLKKKLRAMNSDSNIEEDESFHLFGLYDLVQNGLIKELKDLKDEDEEWIDENELNKDRNGYHLGIDKLVVVDPIYENYKLNADKDHLKSEDKKIGIAHIYEDSYKRLDLETVVVDSKELNAADIDKYNNLGNIRMWMSEVLDHEDIDMISSSHERMKEISAEYGTDKFLFSGIFGYKERSKPSMKHLVGVLLVYTAPFALADMLIIHNYFELVAFEVDAENDEVEFVQIENINLKGINSILRVYIYDVLYQLSSDPKK